jgi:hypothetical protein
VKKQIDLPSWLFEINKKSAMNFRDLVGLYKVSATTLESWLDRGAHPVADFVLTHKRHNREWYVSTVIKFIRSHNEAH